MTRHISVFGAFGVGIPVNREGYFTFSERKVKAILAAIREDRQPPAWATTGCNVAVAEAEVAVAAWRSGS